MNLYDLPLEIIDKITAIRAIVDCGSGYKSLDTLFVDASDVCDYLLDHCEIKDKKPKPRSRHDCDAISKHDIASNQLSFDLNV